ncbi:hypothetical protein PTKIN_Ptkin08bG0019300 [Pterospermum kingtungense]
MKREARQPSMLRNCRVLPSSWNQKPKTRPVQRLGSLQVAGLFFDVPSKPINHSKFTGKCGRPQCLECHLNPVSKSKNKTKGTQKFKTSNMVAGPRLITWRVLDRQPGLNFSGFSATEILEHLYNVNEEDDIDDHVNDDDDDECDNGGTCAIILHDDDNDDFMANFWSIHEKERGEYVDNDDDDDELESVYGYGDDDAMSYCDVELFMLDQTEEDEGWCLLTEM